MTLITVGGLKVVRRIRLRFLIIKLMRWRLIMLIMLIMLIRGGWVI